MFLGKHAKTASMKALRSLLSFACMIVLVILLSWGLRTFVFQAYDIPSGSMETTIMTDDMVFSEKVTYYFGEPSQGDIVTFIDPDDASRVLIKRVVAVGGQTVDLIDGVVYVDGCALDEPYTHGLPSYPLSNSKNITYPYTVGKGELWVMGDNRTNSQDSRYFGSVDAATVTGRAVLIYWPFSHFGLLTS